MQRLVKVTKLKAVDDPAYPTPEWDKYIPGQDNGLVSLPVEYTIGGVEYAPPKVGCIYEVDRRTRNGVSTLGVFMSSIVQSIQTNEENDNLIIWTKNSVYSVEYV